MDERVAASGTTWQEAVCEPPLAGTREDFEEVRDRVLAPDRDDQTDTATRVLGPDAITRRRPRHPRMDPPDLTLTRRRGNGGA